MARVNLWEVMTEMSSERNKELRSHNACKSLQDGIGGTMRFGTELTLEVNEQNGDWIVEIFDHENAAQSVRLRVASNGFVQVFRSRETEGITDERTISF